MDLQDPQEREDKLVLQGKLVCLVQLVQLDPVERGAPPDLPAFLDQQGHLAQQDLAEREENLVQQASLDAQVL